MSTYNQPDDIGTFPVDLTEQHPTPWWLKPDALVLQQWEEVGTGGQNNIMTVSGGVLGMAALGIGAVALAPVAWPWYIVAALGGSALMGSVASFTNSATGSSYPATHPPGDMFSAGKDRWDEFVIWLKDNVWPWVFWLIMLTIMLLVFYILGQLFEFHINF